MNREFSRKDCQNSMDRNNRKTLGDCLSTKTNQKGENTMKKIIFSILMVFIMFVTMIPSNVAKASVVDDIRNIAYADKGKTGSQLKYYDAWCVMWVKDVMRKAGLTELGKPSSATVTGYCNDLADKGLATIYYAYPGGLHTNLSNVKKCTRNSAPIGVGTMVCFTWNCNEKEKYDHIGIITRISNDGQKIYISHGNAGSTGSYKTNYVKFESEYSRNSSQIACFVVPNNLSTNENNGIKEGVYRISSKMDKNYYVGVASNHKSYCVNKKDVSEEGTEWRIVPLGNDRYKIFFNYFYKQGYRYCLDVPGATSGQTQLQIYEENGTSAQTFIIKYDKAKGGYTIQPECASGNFLDMEGGIVQNTGVISYPKHWGDNQIWNLEAVKKTTQSSPWDLYPEPTSIIRCNNNRTQYGASFVQYSLNLICGSNLNVDGYFGSESKRMLMAYQRSKGYLDVDGEVGPLTLEAIRTDLAKLGY